MKKIREAIDKLPSPFPMRVADGVCIPSRDTNEQNVAIGSLIIAKQAGLDLNIAFSNNGTLPDSKIYFLSSVTGWQVLYKSTWDNLIKRVEGGASLVISFAGGQITSFTTLVGAESNGFIGNAAHTVKIGEHTISYTAKTILLSPTTAEVLLRDTNGEPVLLKNKVGKGYVYFINFNVEDQAFNSPDGFNKQPYYLVYKEICRELLEEKVIKSNDPNLGLTVNPTGDGEYVVTVLNYSDTCRRNDTVIKDGYKIKEILYGSGEVIPACDGLILKIQKSE